MHFQQDGVDGWNARSGAAEEIFAFLAARALPSLLPDVQTGGDSGTAAAASILLAVAALAAFSAAATAARVEPLKALRGH